MRKFIQHFDKVYAGFAGLLYAYSFIFFYQYFARKVWAAANSPLFRLSETAVNLTYLIIVLLILGFITSLLSLYLLWKRNILGKVFTHVMLWANLLVGVLMGALVYDIEGRYAKYSWYVATWRWMFVVLVFISIIGLTGLLTKWKKKGAVSQTASSDSGAGAGDS